MCKLQFISLHHLVVNSSSNKKNDPQQYCQLLTRPLRCPMLLGFKLTPSKCAMETCLPHSLSQVTTEGRKS